MIHCLNSAHFNFVDCVPWFILRVAEYISRVIASLSTFLTRWGEKKEEEEGEEEKSFYVIRVNVSFVFKSRKVGTKQFRLACLEFPGYSAMFFT